MCKVLAVPVWGPGFAFLAPTYLWFHNLSQKHHLLKTKCSRVQTQEPMGDIPHITHRTRESSTDTSLHLVDGIHTLGVS